MEDTSTSKMSGQITLDMNWKRKRRNTYMSLILLRFYAGLEFTILHTTSWSYVKEGLKLSNASLWYGLISSGRFMSTFFLTYFISHWFNKHRRLRLCSVLINIAMAAGCVCYAVSSSPAFPFVGTILQGSGFILYSLLNSEIFRSYEADTVQQKILMMQISYAVGEILGPIIVKLMESVDFWVGGIHIMYGNMPILTLFTFSIIRLLHSYFFVHDLSREFDLKETFTNTSHSNNQIKPVTRALGVDIYFLLSQQFITVVLCTSLLPRVIPPLITDTFHYCKLVLDACFLGSSVCILIGALIMRSLKLGSKGVYICGVLSVLSMMISHLTLVVIKVERYNEIVNYTLIVILIISYSMCWIFEDVYLVTTIGKFSPSSRQSYIEGTRMMVAILGSLISSFVSAFIDKYYLHFAGPFIGIITCFIVGMTVRRKTLSDPKVPDDNGIPLLSKTLCEAD